MEIDAEKIKKIEEQIVRKSLSLAKDKDALESERGKRDAIYRRNLERNIRRNTSQIQKLQLDLCPYTVLDSRVYVSLRGPIAIVAIRTNDDIPTAPYEWKAYICPVYGKMPERDLQLAAQYGAALESHIAAIFFPNLALERYKDLLE